MSARSAALAFAILSVAAAAEARADISIGASPAYLEITLDRGKTSAQTILLFNQGKDPVTVTADAWDWWHEPGNNKVFGPPGTLPHSAAKWISFTPKEVMVQPGKAVNVTVVINTPADAVGGHYAVAWFEAIPPGNVKSKELRVGARLGVLIMTDVRGTSHPAVAIENLKVTPPTASSQLKLDLDLVNSGDVHLFPKGTLVLMDKDHKLVGHTGFDKRRMLPGEKEPVSMKYGGELKPGEYQAILTVDYGESGATVTTTRFVVGAATQ